MAKQEASELVNTVAGKREQAYRRYTVQKSARGPWDSRWRDIEEFLLPLSTRFYALDRGRSPGLWNSILDNSGTMALDRLVGGLMSYGTSPARPWIRFRLSDPELNNQRDIAEWLDNASRRVLEVFDISNTYQALAQMYEQLGAYGTAVSIVQPHPTQVIKHTLVPIGEFTLSTDYDSDVVGLSREFSKTCAEMVEEFGYDSCSIAVRSSYDRGDLENKFTIVHTIEPRSNRDPSSPLSKQKAWKSIYFELAGENDQLLLESGFDYFPVLAPRWKVRPGDTYGESPAMRALGDISGLQHLQRHKADVLNHMSDPALQVPTTMANRQIERLPGGTVPYDQNTPHGGVRRLFEVDLDWQGLQADLLDARERIDKSFYADLFAMLSMVSNTTQRTAAEIAVREEEKMSMLGPVSRQLNRELREPLINLAFRQLLEQNLLPPAPEELQGQELSVEYLDIFAQAQKQIGVNSSDRFLNVVANLSSSRPEAFDKLNIDEIVDDYADRYAVNPRFVLSSQDSRVKNLRDSRNQMMAMQQQATLGAVQAKTAKDMAAAHATSAGASGGVNPLEATTGYGGEAGVPPGA